MDKIFLLVTKMPMGFFAFISLLSFFVIYFILYIYINKNLLGICLIIFNDKNKYKSPLELFDFLFISFLPTTFWRETLNLKKKIQFTKLYRKDFYLKMDKEKLNSLLNEFPYFFILQYMTLTFGILYIFLIFGSYYFEI